MQDVKHNPRDIAVLALRDRDGNVTAHVRRLASDPAVFRADRALAGELALGSLRRRGTLLAVMRAFLEHPQRRLPGTINEIILVALYQVLFLERVPQFAAVDEAVKQATRFRHRRQGALVNGLLRAVTRSVSPIQTTEAGSPPPLAADVAPVGPTNFRRFDRPVFPDPSTDPAGHLAAAYSLPEALAERWLDRFGQPGAAQVAMHALVRAPLIVRVNRLKADVPGVLASLNASGVPARPHANGASIVLDEHQNVQELPEFQQGLIQPQDASATAVGLTALPRPGMRVLDFCAAPGTKTTHLAELMGNRGSITALDVSASKLQRIVDNCRRMGVSIVTTLLSEQAGGLEPESFDLVLVDAPCTNTGVLARRAEARWRFDEQRLAEIVRDQRFLAAAGAQFVRRGGRLVYSTCSIEPEECAQVARRLTQQVTRLALVSEELALPAGANDPASWRDGGYTAVFEAK